MAEALAAGVAGGVTAALWVDDFSETLALTRGRPDLALMRHGEALPRNRFAVFVAAGLHPLLVGERWLADDGSLREDVIAADAEAFRATVLAEREFVWAIGETGFDLSRDVVSCELGQRAGRERLWEVQRRAFDVCAGVALELGLPLVIHTRGAWAATLEQLTQARERGLAGAMLHCFSGSREELNGPVAKAGFLASFSGVVAHSEARRMQGAAAGCPRDLLVVETDSPDLSPTRPDGTRRIPNVPSEVRVVAERIAELRGEDLAEVARLATGNLMRFLGMGAGSAKTS